MLGFFLSPLRVGLVHCGNWWLGVGAHRYEQNNGALVSARFDSHNTGRVCVSAAGDSADPSRQCAPERKKGKKTGEKTKSETMKSLFIHLSEPLSQCTPHCSAFFVLHTQIWLVHQTMSGELGWGGLGSPLLAPPNQNHRWVKSPY